MLNKLSVRIYQIVLFVCVTFFPLLCFAAKEADEPKIEFQTPGWSAYMMAYMLVVLCIGLALMVTCAPVHRRDKPLQKD
ncbi:MAG: hypothetical protein IJQ39_09300 [Thermoguttaceae bacterium]|nr:hypothetical protein [Thermoguttaceae bacterium]